MNNQPSQKIGRLASILTLTFWGSGTLYNGPMFGIGLSMIGLAFGILIEEHHGTPLPFWRQRTQTAAIQQTAPVGENAV